MSTEVPLIDLSRWYGDDDTAKEALVAEVDAALRDIGFLLVTGHRVEPAGLERLRAAGLRFFRLPAEVKAAYAGVIGGRGWVPPGLESNAGAYGLQTPPDLKEGYRSGPTGVPESVRGTDDESWYAPNTWPREVAEFEAATVDFAAQANDLAGVLLTIGARALGLADDFFTSRCDVNPYTVAMNWYPSLDSVGAALDEQFRVGQHTDFGTLTVLDRQIGSGGLQVRTADGTWVDAPYVPGALTINTGDLLARWSGDRWRSTPHRVLPPSPDSPAEELLSLVLFHGANPRAVIETLDSPLTGPVRYPPVLGGDFLRERLAAVTVRR